MPRMDSSPARPPSGRAGLQGSPEGRAIMGKLGSYMGELMPQIQREVLRALDKAREEMRI